MADQRWQSRQYTPPPEGPQAAQGRWQKGGGGGLAPFERGPIVIWLGGVLALTLTVLLFVLVLFWFAPVSLPRLYVLTARYRDPTLPPNAFALHDVHNLLAQTRVFVPELPQADSLNLAEMQAALSSLAATRFPRSVFGQAQHSVVVYVNALGYCIWNESEKRSVACILPDDFSVHRSTADGQPDLLTQCVSLHSVVEHLASIPAANKLLVLDCQRAAQCWPLGVVQNDFMDVVQKELADLPADQTRGLFVLLSNRGDETAWTDPTAGRSVFGNEFVRGITGDADRTDAGGDADGRVTLDELDQFLGRRVSDWTRSNRNAEQTPLLETFQQDARAVVLTTLGRSASKFRAPSDKPMAPGSDRLARLETSWREFAEISVALPSPLLAAPAAWKAYEFCLRRAELFALAGDPDAMDAELKTAVLRKDALLGVRRRFAETIPPYSLALIDYGNTLTTPAPGPAAASQPAAAEASIPAIAASFAAGKTETPAALQQYREARISRLPVEAEWLNLVDAAVADVRPSLSDKQITETFEAARRLTELRIRAERTAAPAGDVAPYVWPYLKAELVDADLLRRLLEDLVLLTNQPKQPVGSGVAGVPPTLAGVQQRYDSAAANAAIAAEAIKTYRAALSELPDWTRFGCHLHFVGNDPAVAESFAHVEQLVVSTSALAELLRQDPTKWPAQTRFAQLQQLKDLTRSIESHRAFLLARLADFARALQVSNETPLSVPQWRQLDLLRTGPVVVAGISPEQFAVQRMRLLRLLQRPTTPLATNSLADAPRPNPTSESLRQRKMALVQSCLAIGLVGAAEQVSAGADQTAENKTQNQWRTLHASAIEAEVDPGDPSRLAQQFAAELLVAIDLPVESPRWKHEWLERHWRSRFFAWQSERATEDFWGSDAGNQAPFFSYWSQELLSAARRQFSSSDQMAWVQSAEEGLRNRIRAAAQLTVEPPAVQILGETRVGPLLLRTTDIDSFPPGVARLRWETDAKVAQVRPRPNVSAEPGHFFELAPNTPSGVGNAIAELFFRGRRWRAKVPFEILNDEAGPAVVYRDLRPPTGKLAVRLADAPAADVRLLFVLDCSSSMSENGRMTAMRQVLEQFSAGTPPGTIWVGVRLFGDQVVWSKDQPETEALAHKDTRNVLPVTPFDPDAFEAALRLMNPKGSTPLFQALLDAQGDFADVTGGRKIILVISDGADNWALIGKPPGVQQLADAYEGSDIRIHTIGFQTPGSDFSQLRDIAAVGQGTAVLVTQSQDLLRSVTGMVGLLQYSVRSGARVTHEPRPLLSRPTDLTVEPNVYQVQVTSPAGEVLAVAPRVVVQRGQRHDLIYRSGTLLYAPPPFADSVAETHEPPLSLLVLRAQPDKDGVALEFALRHDTQSDWQPEDASITVRCGNGDVAYAVRSLPPNVPGFHVPVWHLQLTGWPADERAGELELAWSGDGGPPLVFESDWGKPPVDSRLPPGLEVRFGDVKERPIDGRKQNSAVVKLIFPLPLRPQLADWSAGINGPAQYIRRILNHELGVSTTYVVVGGEANPAQLVLRPPRTAAPGRSIKVRFPIGLPAINRRD